MWRLCAVLLLSPVLAGTATAHQGPGRNAVFYTEVCIAKQNAYLSNTTPAVVPTNGLFEVIESSRQLCGHRRDVLLSGFLKYGKSSPISSSNTQLGNTTITIRVRGLLTDHVLKVEGVDTTGTGQDESRSPAVEGLPCDPANVAGPDSKRIGADGTWTTCNGSRVTELAVSCTDSMVNQAMTELRSGYRVAARCVAARLAGSSFVFDQRKIDQFMTRWPGLEVSLHEQGRLVP